MPRNTAVSPVMRVIMTVGMLAGVLVASRGSASADIDVSGRWLVRYVDDDFGEVARRSLTLVQTGTTVAVSAPYDSGTIDLSNGLLSLVGTSSCGLGGPFVPRSLHAAVPPDAASFSGIFSERARFSPTACFDLSGTVEGVRLPDTCGDGVVDAGEVCDQGMDGECCDEFCLPRPTTYPCTALGGACFLRARCDGAGSCAQLPKPAGTQCRGKRHDCDTPELCDGVAVTCPPESSPTEPDVDGDGTLDPCDDCVGNPLEKVRLTFGRVGGGDDDDYVTLRARVRLAEGDTLPLPPAWGTFRHFNLYDATGDLLLRDGAPTYGNGASWQQKGTRWIWIDPPAAGTKPTRVEMVPVKNDPTVWEMRVKAPSASLLGSAPVPPYALDVVLDRDVFATSTNRCGRIAFGLPDGPAPRCSAPRASGVIRCR